MSVRTATRVLLTAVVIYGGCATKPWTSEPSQPSQSPSSQPSIPRPAPPVNLSGYSPAFKQGYSDGCASVRGSMRRDETRYRSDNDYMMGWSDGNSVCQKRR